MPTHAEKRKSPHSAAEMYALVEDVRRYPEFLPWCTGCRIRSQNDSEIVADLLVGFKMVRERFQSRVKLTPKDRIDVTYEDGPFHYLNNHWIFIPEQDGGCTIDFFIDFEFRSKLLQKIMEALFSEAVRRMVGAFEERANEIYGPKSS